MNTPIVLEAASTEQHFNQILSLQKKNHYTEISAEQQSQNGFVFVQHTIEILQTMAVAAPQIIALHNDQVVGYTLAMTPSMKDKLPCLVPMFVQFEQVKYKGRALNDYRYIVGGQICVSKEFRGIGLSSMLYNETKKRAQDTCELCVTEVSRRNVASLKAHLKVGFEVAHTYEDGKEVWDILVWDFRKEKN